MKQCNHCPAARRALIEQLEMRQLLTAAAETPFLGTPFTTNQTVPAVDYDKGGPGVGYYIATPGKPSNVNYRPGDAVCIQKVGTTGMMVASAFAGEWLRYSFDIPTAGSYELEASVANLAAGGEFQANFASVDATGLLTVPRTGGWQTFQTVQSAPFTLSAGATVMTILLDKNALGTVVGNLQSFMLVPSKATTPTPVPPATPPTTPGLTSSWESVAANPLAMAESEGAVVNGKLYVIGGHIEIGTAWVGVDQTDVYDPATNVWQRLADCPQALSEAAVAADGDYIYVAGGYVTGSNDQQTFATANVWRYDTLTNVWAPFVSLPQARAAGALVLLGNELHYFGGSDIDRVDQTTHWELDLSSASPQWTVAAPMPAARNRMGAVALNGLIYSVGGQTGYDANAILKSDVYVWNPSDPGAWTTAAALPGPESHLGAAAVVIDGEILVVGGDTSINHYTADVTAYDPATNVWTRLTPLPQPRFAVVAAAIGDEMIVTTGYDTSMTDTTWACIESP